MALLHPASSPGLNNLPCMPLVCSQNRPARPISFGELKFDFGPHDLVGALLRVDGSKQRHRRLIGFIVRSMQVEVNCSRICECDRGPILNDLFEI